MKLRGEHFAGPLFASATLGIGIGFVLAVNAFAAFFTVPATIVPQHNIGVTSTENFRTLTSKESPHEKGRVLACYDMTILPVWRALKDDEEFKERIAHANDLVNCSDMIEITKVDLNDDFAQEVIVRGKAPYLCTSGNCAVWVFDAIGRKILVASDHAEVVGLDSPIQRSKTRGYFDLVLKERLSDSEARYRTYAFDASDTYVESRCVHEQPKYRRDGDGSRELVPCGAP